MKLAQLARESFGPPPGAYTTFIAEMRSVAAQCGLSWNVAVELNGRILRKNDWDLRKLNGSHRAHGGGCTTFAVEVDTRDNMLSYGVPAAVLPLGEKLSDACQDFVKAVLVHRCTSGVSLATAQASAKACRRLFSSTRRPPWALREEDFSQLIAAHTWTEKAQRDVRSIAQILDQRLMSVNCPVSPQLAKRRATELPTGLNERVRNEKLPERDALLELTRIVFKEEPQHHNDRIWFCAVRLMILTGLRLNEICMLPYDCFDWHEHMDVVTGKSAGDVGGIGKSLRLRYFAEKHPDGGPDVLVEAFQWVPGRFEGAVVKAVEEAQAATTQLRTTLAGQWSDKANFPESDFRTFKTTSGTTIKVTDFLLLCTPLRKKFRFDDARRARIAVRLTTDQSVATCLGQRKGDSFFTKYSRTPELRALALRSHSLRHLMNTEFFRQNVPDTAITHQFGRKTVAQSYEYDHRTLAERLQFVSLPEASQGLVQKGTTQELVAKMVVSGIASTSHVGKSFARIQREHGDRAAFSYLSANSDGFHVTPYGFCTNSFSVNPCARHLKCFDECKHFAPSGQVEHIVTLQELRENLLAMRNSAAAKPAVTVGRRNQIAHAERLMQGVDAALAAQPGLPVFPHGTDHSTPRPDLFK